MLHDITYLLNLSFQCLNICHIIIGRKTTLLNQVNKPLREANGYSIVCKFNQTDSPDTILAAGFDSFFESMFKEDDGVKREVKNRIDDALGERVA